MSIIIARKHGNSIYLCIPSLVCKRGNIKSGDIFRIEKDILLPDRFELTKLSNDSEI